MVKVINKYRSMSFEEKTIFSSKLSIISNSILAVCKFVLSFFASSFFIVAAIINVLIAGSKLECYLGEKFPERKSFEYRNKMIGIFLLTAGLEYAIYMGRLVFTDVNVMDYSMVLGISVATVSFVELGFAIKGCFNSFGKGHYYRNLKLISLCSALTAIVLTEVALTSFSASSDTRVINGLFGMGVGIIIVLISIYIFVAPYVSIVDREYNEYQLKKGFEGLKEEKIVIPLTFSRFYGNYSYKGVVSGDLIKGSIIKEKSPLFKWNIYIKILVVVLSEILIFPYAFGALVFHFKNATLISKLDNKMAELNYQKVGD